MAHIILASGSPRRTELLKQIGLEHSVIPSDVEEDINSSMKPEQAVKALALIKAMHIAKQFDRNTDTIVIGADTIVVRNGKIYGKPDGEQAARQMLKELSDGEHIVMTGLAIVDPWLNKSIVDCEQTLVTMRPINDQEIEYYVKSGEPLDKAGAYAIQGKGAVFVTSLSGCYFNVVGLPLAKLTAMLGEFGVKPNWARTVL